VLEADEAEAAQAAGDALALLHAGWEAETTARDVPLIREARAARGEVYASADEIERTLNSER
jgi:hypothetical protein